MSLEQTGEDAERNTVEGGRDAGRPLSGAALRTILTDAFAAEPRVLDWASLPLDAPAPSADRLRAWVAEGLHGGLAYMEDRLDERVDPRVHAPWATAAVLFLLRPAAPPGADTGALRVAGYALGNDYHRAAHRILDRIEARLADAFPALRFGRFCDTSPVLERDLAAAAGLGWRGKNTMLLNRRHGSAFMLAGFFLDADPDARRAPEEDFCGGCTACLTACPTDAFVAPGKLDAGKCVSTWTIERKGDIPEELAARFGDRIFGCDACQTACPWNHKPIRAAREAEADSPVHAGRENLDAWPRDGLAWLDLLRRGGGFRSLLRRTPLNRAGRQNLIRNVLVALRNTGVALPDDVRDRIRTEESDEAVRRLVEGSGQ